MVQVLLPARLFAGSRRLCCAGRCPWRGAGISAGAGQGGFVPDVLLSGAVLLVCQSYAAGYSKAGVLRWYMVATAFAAALCVAGVLGIPLRALGRGIRAVLCLPGRILHRFAVQPLCRRRAAAKIARKLRRNAERTAKKSKKELAKPAGIVV